VTMLMMNTVRAAEMQAEAKKGSKKK